MTDFEINTRVVFCFELDSSEIYITPDGLQAFASVRGDSDDDVEDIVLMDKGVMLFKEEIALFGSDTLDPSKLSSFLEVVNAKND
jgi:hypothetical protein